MEKFIELMNKLADISGDILRSKFRQVFLTSSKGDIPSNTVTEVDQLVEKTIKEEILKVFPDHNFVGEETENIKTKSIYTWVIDPIDGTSAFVCGKPTFCTLIGLLKNNKPYLGLINQPISNERWIGGEGMKTLFNNQVCKTSDSLQNLRICATTPLMFNEEEFGLFKKLTKICTTKNWGGDAYLYGLLAIGQIDIVCESDLQIYDIAALIPIIEGTGGTVTDWQGNKIVFDNFNHQFLACSNSEVLKRVLEVLNKS